MLAAPEAGVINRRREAVFMAQVRDDGSPAVSCLLIRTHREPGVCRLRRRVPLPPTPRGREQDRSAGAPARAQGGGALWFVVPHLESPRCGVKRSHPRPAGLRFSLAVSHVRAGSFLRSPPSQTVHAFLTLPIHPADSAEHPQEQRGLGPGLLCWSPLPVPRGDGQRERGACT